MQSVQYEQLSGNAQLAPFLLSFENHDAHRSRAAAIQRRVTKVCFGFKRSPSINKQLHTINLEVHRSEMKSNIATLRMSKNSTHKRGGNRQTTERKRAKTPTTFVLSSSSSGDIVLIIISKCSASPLFANAKIELLLILSGPLPTRAMSGRGVRYEL